MKTILALLLHHVNRHANRFSKASYFYVIKNRILARHGKVIGQDIQLIEAYDARIVSRLQEMFTIIELPENAPDLRKMYA